MIGRRELLIGASCLVGAGAAVGLKPRRHTSLLGKDKVEATIPTSFGDWSAAGGEGLVKPKVEGLAARLYNEVVQRTYVSEVAQAEVMLLIAYGGTQSDLLQVHRPEVCYPAIGFQIESKRAGQLPLPGGSIPVVRVVAVQGDRKENIVYWTRVGEDMPTDGGQQRKVLLVDAMKGFVPDGVLVRASVVDDNPERGFRVLNAFVPALLKAVPAGGRPALIGTAPSESMLKA